MPQDYSNNAPIFKLQEVFLLTSVTRTILQWSFNRTYLLSDCMTDPLCPTLKCSIPLVRPQWTANVTEEISVLRFTSTLSVERLHTFPFRTKNILHEQNIYRCTATIQFWVCKTLDHLMWRLERDYPSLWFLSGPRAFLNLKRIGLTTTTMNPFLSTSNQGA